MTPKAKRWPDEQQWDTRMADACTRIIDGSVRILPPAGDPAVCLVHPPTCAHRKLASSKRRGEHWQDLDRPPMNRRVIDEHAALAHHLLDLTEAQRVAAYAHGLMGHAIVLSDGPQSPPERLRHDRRNLSPFTLG
jgi:hypothetical protein